ncbi:MAG: hypothetical protein R3F49_02170 [Planctomycetota bacterium]
MTDRRLERAGAPEGTHEAAAADAAAASSRVAVDGRRVLRLWLPLGASWLLMACEPVLVIRAISGLADPTIQLASWSSVVFPVSLAVEAPIIMILAASTALSTDARRYAQVGRFTLVLGLALTALHALIAFTPLYDFVAGDLLASRPEVLDAARLGLMLMLPWTFAIGWRRYQQGLLIRYERSGDVGRGTLVRLVTTASVLYGLSRYGALDGVVVAALGVCAGVIAEALYAHGCATLVRPRLRATPLGEPLTRAGFVRFYGPLALTPLITLFIQPIGAASMNRMPRDLESVAAWGPVHALVFLSRSVGMAFNEVVVTLAGLSGGLAALRRFALWLAGGTVAALALVAATPLGAYWFDHAQHLPPSVAELARGGALLALVMPATQVAQSWYQGLLVHRRTTRPITEAVVLYFALSLGLLQLGIVLAGRGVCHWPGVYWTVATFSIASVVQTWWLHRRTHSRLAPSAREAELTGCGSTTRRRARRRSGP